MPVPVTQSSSRRRALHIGAVLLAASACTSMPVNDPPAYAAAAGADIAVRALAHLGVPYRLGGDDPSGGFDCSGLVRYVFRGALGLDLPRRSEDMARAGRPVARGRLRPGDLVFFNTQGSAFSHVGIYIGDGRFVHAPAARGRVRIDTLDERYWADRFDGARRFAGRAETAGSRTDGGDSGR